MPVLDLFESAQNTQVDRFFSYNFDHRSVGADAFLCNWRDRGLLCACPPPILVGRVLQKLRVGSCLRSTVLVPAWQAQSWFLTLLQVLRTPPLLLPNERWIVTDPLGHQAWPMRWPLIACDLPGSLASATASRRACLRNAGPHTAQSDPDFTEATPTLPKRHRLYFCW